MTSKFLPVLTYENLYFVDGSSIELPTTGVIVFVGPNNAGKTTAVRELEAYLTQRKFTHNNRLNSVFKDATLRRATDEDFNKWLEWFLDPVLPDPIQNPEVRRYRNWGGNINAHPQRLIDLFHTDGPLMELSQLVIGSGMSAAFEGNTPNFYDEGANTNKQFDELILNPDLEKLLRDLSVEAFGVPIAISRMGSHSHLHFGELPELSDPPTKDQQAELRAAPRVVQQGQGVVSLINIAQSMLLGKEPIVFIDEPEAHLHPPQAKLAGKYIAQRAQKSQVFITTHSVDLLIGLINTKSTNVTIVRLDRDGQSSPKVSTLKDDDVIKAWKDPIIRYSRALSGLVHKGVVICESDADCLYYEVSLDFFRDEVNEQSHDLLFIHSGGNAGAKKIVPALMNLSVPLCVVVDFDTLRDWDKLRALFKQLGGDSSIIEPLWKIVNNQLKSRGEKRKNIDIKAELGATIDQEPSSDLYSKDLREKLTPILRLNSGWDDAKKHGLNALSGEPNKKAQELLKELEKVGLIVCPFGELESFHRGIVGNPHGPEWATKAIQEALYKDLGKEQRDFITSIPTKLARSSIVKP